jgi:hypothetical protein
MMIKVIKLSGLSGLSSYQVYQSYQVIKIINYQYLWAIGVSGHPLAGYPDTLAYQPL